MNCLACSRMNLQAYPKHAAVGIGHCQLAECGVFISICLERSCKKFLPAPAEVIAKRTPWALKEFGRGPSDASAALIPRRD